MKRLCEEYKDYFRVGAAIGGLLLYSDEERLAHFNAMKERFKNFPRPAGMPEFKIPEPPLGPLIDTEIARQQFNLIVAENDTKMCNVYFGEDKFFFDNADKLIKFGKENGQDIRWHTLVWHNQSPDWIFKDEKGEKVSKEVLEARLKKYIETVGKRYGDDVCSVDVVNECISDKNFVLRDGEDRSQWYDILGPDYVEKAFFWAKEAFPKSSLVINDYNLEMVPGKREGMYKLLKQLLAHGTPVDTVGLQMHINVDYPPVSEIEKTIELFGSLGLNVIVTEMEISAYSDDKQPRREYDENFQKQLADRYEEVFECFKKEAKAGLLKDVVMWGVSDRFTWKNDFPVIGRTDAPLLFDVKGNPKPAFDRLVK